MPMLRLALKNQRRLEAIPRGFSEERWRAVWVAHVLRKAADKGMFAQADVDMALTMCR